MKKILLILAIVVSGSVYSKNIPGPFWYSISEKIFSETHQLLNPEAKDLKISKAKTSKAAKPSKDVLKCQPKKQTIFPFPYLTNTGSDMWIMNE